MNFTFGGKERLKSLLIIQKLFLQGKSVTHYPIKIVYLPVDFTDGSEVKVGVSVGKKNFKKAVDRNRIKRLLREAYRLNKHILFNNISTSYALMILYIGKDGTDFETINVKTKQTLTKLSERIAANKILP
ncbi:MAG: ribonuclease P protein component [Flavobacteriaceae bacterium]|nr:ribonuclease P protein component [Flavobacteriaceae bacterium]